MSSVDRQNSLLVAEDWKKIYQTYQNADFKSYDFENLRRIMIDYIRINYPEDFNDYIESSEYLALIDLIGFVGQNVAFRVDLNARENFLELAERRDSILKLSRLVGYNAKRNIAANGLLKFTNIQTTENVYDTTGRNLSNQVITWNDSSNSNWFEQFITVINASLDNSQPFGNPISSSTIYGIPTNQYRFNTNSNSVPLYSFTKTISGSNMDFEITPTTFNNQSFIYEEPPKIGNNISCIFRDDGKGSSSTTNGFFFNFVQGSTNTGTFTITQPSANYTININSNNINNSDVWLYQLDSNGSESILWTQVPALNGNNVVYNSLNKNVKNIYSITTNLNDTISLNFGDGTFGNIPNGTFRIYYRISNGLSYIINTQDIKSVGISIPYVSHLGQSQTLTITMGLFSSVSNSSSSETNNSIKLNAPQNYYTQNRMISGEDYNINPLSINQSILKVKSINRTSSGISRYFDLSDVSGKYSRSVLFSDDGIIYEENYTSEVTFNYTTRMDIEGVIYNQVNNILNKVEVRNFYYDNYITTILNSNLPIIWTANTNDINTSSGKFYLNSAIIAIGTSSLSNVSIGSLIKFIPPVGYYFDTNNNNKLVMSNYIGTVNYIWSSIVYNSAGILTLSNNIPSGSIMTGYIPKFNMSLTNVNSIINLIYTNQTFGLRYDITTQNWVIIFDSNINPIGNFSRDYEGNTLNNNLDSSWLILFTTDNNQYIITSREKRYIFESDKNITFYFDNFNKIYDPTSNSIVDDTINIMSINTKPNSLNPYSSDIIWKIDNYYIGDNGYIDNKKIIISFMDNDNNGIVDNPELFNDIVNNSYVIEKKYLISDSLEEYRYVDNSSNVIIILSSENGMNKSLYSTGQYFYFIDHDVVKVLLNNGILVVSSDYRVYMGRDKLKFQYVHNADYNSRIDPSQSNIIDIYILTKNYDISYRLWVSGILTTKPLPPSSDELNNILSPSLNLIKATSDEIIYHPVQYTELFGSTANPELQATFKIVKTEGIVISDNDVITQVLSAINNFFDITNWNFGDTFYFSELSTYIMYQVSPYVSSVLIVPKQSNLNFGNLFEIPCDSNKIFISSASINDIEIINGITSTNIKTSTIINNTSIAPQLAISSPYGNF